MDDLRLGGEEEDGEQGEMDFDIEDLVVLTKEEIKEQKKADKKAKRIEKKIQKKIDKDLKEKQNVRDHLARELMYSKKNLYVLRAKWRKMAVDSQMPVKLAELEEARVKFERLMDLKDSTISGLLDAVDEASDQHYFMMQAHAYNIDKLLGSLYTYLRECDDTFKANIKKLCDDWDKEKELLNGNKDMGELHLQTMIFTMEKIHSDYTIDRNGEFCSKLSETENRLYEILLRLHIVLDIELTVVWDQFMSVLHEYHSTSKELKKEVDILMEKDNAMSAEIAAMMNMAQKLFECIRELRNELSNLKIEQGIKIDDLTVEKEFFSKCYQILKDRFNKDRARDKKQMELLSALSMEASEHLKNILKKAEDLLKVCKMCRKYELEKEKVIPFPYQDNTMTENVVFADTLEFIQHLPRMDAFWFRVGQADAKRVGLRQEYDELLDNNTVMCRVLKDVCVGVDRTSFEKLDIQRKQSKNKFTSSPCTCPLFKNTNINDKQSEFGLPEEPACSRMT